MQNCARFPWLNNSSSNTTPRDRDHRPQVAFLIITSHKHYPRFHREWFCDAAERSEEEVARPDPEGKPSREGKRERRKRREAAGVDDRRRRERERQRGKLRRNKTTRRESEGEREKERAGMRTKRRLGTNHEKSRWNLNFAQTCAFRCVYLDTPPAHALCTHPFRKKLVSGRWEQPMTVTAFRNSKCEYTDCHDCIDLDIRRHFAPIRIDAEWHVTEAYLRYLPVPLI